MNNNFKLNYDIIKIYGGLTKANMNIMTLTKVAYDDEYLGVLNYVDDSTDLYQSNFELKTRNDVYSYSYSIELCVVWTLH